MVRPIVAPMRIWNEAFILSDAPVTTVCIPSPGAGRGEFRNNAGAVPAHPSKGLVTERSPKDHRTHKE